MPFYYKISRIWCFIRVFARFYCVPKKGINGSAANNIKIDSLLIKVTDQTIVAAQ